LLLLIGAGLLLRTVGHLLAVDPGFTARRVLSMRLHAPPGIGPDRWQPLNQQIEERLRALPGVEAVGQISRVPFGALPNVLQGFEIEDQPVAPPQRPSIDVRYATTDYFRTMGIPLLRGRLVIEQDMAMAVVNEAAARRFWPGQDPLGKRVRSAGSADPFTEWHTIVGIVGNVHHSSLEEPARPELYYYAGMDQRASLVVRTGSDPTALVPALRATILQVEPRATISSVETLDNLVLKSMGTRRFGMRLLGAFAALAMFLAALGLYGVMSYTIAQRRQEIGVRMALGAQSREVWIMVVREGMALVIAGSAIGLLAALALSGLMSGLVHGVDAWDPLTLTVVPALLATVALLTAYLAARRAARIEPMIALRQG
jgi:predicted permease